MLGRIHQPLHRLDGVLELGLLVTVELDLDDALDAAGADHHRHADIDVVDAILPGEIGGAGQHPLLVLEIAFGHGDGRRGRGVIGRAGLQQADDFGAAVAGALHDLVDPLLGGPLHGDEIGHRECRRPSNSATSGTMVSPWPPSTKAVTSSTETLNSSARK